MKRQGLVLIILFFLGAIQVFSQKLNAAEIQYSVSHSGYDSDILADLPTQITFYVFGNNTEQIVVSPKSTMKVLANCDSMFMANISEMGNNKEALVYYNDDIKESLSSLDIKIKPTKLTKRILGYLCTGYEISIFNKLSNEHMTDIVYVTNQIGGENLNFYLYRGLKGFILYSERHSGKEITVIQAKKIIPKNFTPQDFLIPDTYTIIPYKEQLKLDK
jgi:hypothetical protein